MSDQRTALVLGGGGITGIAWEIGLLAGLAEAGVDLSDADLVVGTSAGSVVGAQLTSGADPEKLYARQLEPPSAGAGGPAAAARRWPGSAWAMLRTRGRDQDFRRRVGALALPPRSGRRDARRSRSGWTSSARGWSAREWPERALRVTAVDAQSGEFRTFDRDSGVPLVQAVAASCAVPGRVPAGHHRRPPLRRRRHALGRPTPTSPTGYERVVVLAPIPRGVGPMASVDAQVTAMVARVAVVSPDQDSRTAIGRNVLDPAARAPLRAGRPRAGRRGRRPARRGLAGG